MDSLLGQHFLARRLALGLTKGQLARLIGSTNHSKMGTRIAALEGCGTATADLLIRLAAVLGIDLATVDRLAAEDHRRYLEDWNRWADEPITPSLIIHLMPAFYSSQKLPEPVKTQDEAEAWASARAKELKHRCCLVWSRRLAVFYCADGTVEGRQVATPKHDPRPVMQIKNKKFLLSGMIGPSSQSEQPR